MHVVSRLAANHLVPACIALNEDGHDTGWLGTYKIRLTAVSRISVDSGS